MIGFIMTPFHIDWLPTNAYADYTLIFSWMMFINVVLSYGMETAFFRFYNKREDKPEVVNNTILFLMGVCGVYLGCVYLFKSYIDHYFGIPPVLISFLILISVLDAFPVTPFAILRAQQRPVKYCAVKLMNVVLNAGLSVVFLYVIPVCLSKNPESRLNDFFIPNFEVGYLFVSNLIASMVTLFLLSKYYLKLRWSFNKDLDRKSVV